MKQENDAYQEETFVFECVADITESSVFAALVSDKNSDLTVGCGRPSITQSWRFHSYSKKNRLPITDLDERSLRQDCENLQSTRKSSIRIEFRVIPTSPLEPVKIQCGAGSLGSLALSTNIIKSKGEKVFYHIQPFVTYIVFSKIECIRMP